MKKLILSLFLVTTAWVSAQVKSPSQFIPDYGKHITFYHQVEDYFGHLVAQTSYIKPYRYGQTAEHRNLNVYYISTPENLANLEQIRLNNLASIGMAPNQSKTVGDKLIVWLSFNVHGNEWAGTESALTVAYELTNPENKTTKEWLKNIVVILDPCVNPDGYSRYGNWLHEIAGKNTHPGLTDREHMEEWPGGRYNHYIFDLNRDWAWQTQKESQQRIALYNQWMPQVHTDVHEQGYNSPYFFPPSAEPLHEFIEPYQRNFHALLGKNIAAKFDAQNWLYNTSERFDLFYPSYGDTYPTYNGAVGMTVEQGGIGAGREVTMENGVSVTIKDRLTHHATTVLTIVESAASQVEPLLKGFRGFMNTSRKTMKGKYATYVMKSNPKLEQLADLLQKNKIEFSYADAKQSASGFNYQTKKENSFTIEPNDMIVKVDQQKAVFAQILFEPNHKLNDSLSYDITAWALPLAYGVEGYALKNAINIKTKPTIETTSSSIPSSVYAFHIPWNNRTSAQVVALLHQKGIKVRSAMKQAVFGSTTVEPGGLIVSKGDNPKVVDFEKVVGEIVKKKSDFSVISSGFSKNARDLGGENFPLLTAPKILFLSGRGVNSTDFGSVWFYLEETVGYPVSIVDLDRFRRVRLHEFNTLILADGNYDFSEGEQKRINEWVSSGGKIIAMNGALDIFDGKDGFALNAHATDDDKQKAEKTAKEKALKKRFLDSANEERRAMSDAIPGAIIENVLDVTHPMAFGLGKKYFSLKTDSRHYALLKNASNIAYVPKGYKSYGFVGHEIGKELPETVNFAIDYKGSGKVIYMVDNPLFRAFWENGNLLFSNALFLVN